MASIYNDERSIEPNMIAINVVEFVMAIGHVRKISLSMLSSWHGFDSILDFFCFASMGQKNVMGPFTTPHL